MFLTYNTLTAIVGLFFSNFSQLSFYDNWYVIDSFPVTFIYESLTFCLLCGCVSIISWFNGTVTAYWNYLSSLTRFNVAFLFFIQSGESI